MERVFTGLIPAIVTPFNHAGQIDFPSFIKILYRFKEAKIEQVVVSGTTGEGVTLTDKEFVSLIEAATEHKHNIIANVGTNNTQQSVLRTEQAKEAGAKAALVIMPYYNCPPLEGIIAHFRAIAEVGLPIMAYYHPKRTGVILTREELSQLLQIEGVLAIKDASLQFPNGLETQIFAGDDEVAIDYMAKGATGVVSVLANAFPKEMQQIITYANKGQYSTAQRALDVFKPLFVALKGTVNPQGIKGVLSSLGLCQNRLRLPLVPTTKVQQKSIEQAITLCTSKHSLV